MAEAPEPTRKFYALKPKEFERVNPPGRGSESASTGETSALPSAAATNAPLDSGPIDVRQLAQIAAARAPLLSGNAPANRANDVHAMLHHNHAQAEAAGLNEVSAAPPRRSKRKRDYWLLLVAGNSFIFALYSIQIFIGFQVQCLASQMPMEFYNLLRYAASTPAMYAIPSLGILFFSCALTWLMFHVMNDY